MTFFDADLSDKQIRSLSREITQVLENPLSAAYSDIRLDLSYSSGIDGNSQALMGPPMDNFDSILVDLSYSDASLGDLVALAKYPKISHLTAKSLKLGNFQIGQIVAAALAGRRTRITIDCGYNHIDRISLITAYAGQKKVFATVTEEEVPESAIVVVVMGVQLVLSAPTEASEMSKYKQEWTQLDETRIELLIRNETGFKWTDLVDTEKRVVSPIPMEYISGTVVRMIPDWMLKSALKQAMSLENDSDIPAVKLAKFGSCVNGFGTRKSDVDLVVVPEDMEDLEWFGELYRIADTQKRASQDFLYHLQQLLPGEIGSKLVKHARIPVLKISKFPVSPAITVAVDISFFNPAALNNSLLLRRFCCLDRRGYLLGHLVKLWAKTQNLVSQEDNEFSFPSSYAWILMCMYYLQVRLGAVPSLIGKTRRAQETWGCRSSFYLPTEISDPFATMAEWKLSNPLDAKIPRTVFSLFSRFLEFLVADSEEVVMDLRRQAKTRDAVITVIDPIETTRVVTRNVQPDSWRTVKNVALSTLERIKTTSSPADFFSVIMEPIPVRPVKRPHLLNGEVEVSVKPVAAPKAVYVRERTRPNPKKQSARFDPLPLPRTGPRSVVEGRDSFPDQGDDLMKCDFI